MRARATESDKRAEADAKTRMRPVLDQLAAVKAELDPYEQIKKQLAESRAQYRELTSAFIRELSDRCGAMNEDEHRTTVLNLFAGDLYAGFDEALSAKRQDTMSFLTTLWDKYRVSLIIGEQKREESANRLGITLRELGYA